MTYDPLEEFSARPVGPPSWPVHLAWRIWEDPPRLVVVEHHYNRPPERLLAQVEDTGRTGDADQVLESHGWDLLTGWVPVARNVVAIVRNPRF